MNNLRSPIPQGIPNEMVFRFETPACTLQQRGLRGELSVRPICRDVGTN